MKIAFCGAQGVGKTTLMKRLEQDELIWGDHKFLYEMVRSLTKYGFKINEEGNDISQRVIMLELFAAAYMNHAQVADRCVLDSLAYTVWLHRQGKVSDELFNWACCAMRNAIYEYNIVFFIEPEFDIVSDGVRSIDKGYQSEINSIFNALIAEEGISVVRLSGSVDDRINQIYNAIEEQLSL